MEATPSNPSEDVLVSGDLVLDLPAHQAWAGSRPIHLSHLQFVVLVTLVRSAGRVVTTDELTVAAAHITPLNRRTISSAMSRVRRRLGTGPRRPRIEVTRSRGYTLIAPTA